MMDIEIGMEPSEVSVTKEKDALKLIYGEHVVTVTAGTLWRNCRSARAIRGRLMGVEPAPDYSVKIAEVQLIGRYGLNIAFTDGSDRGIYPWSFLQLLANEARDEHRSDR